jgi:hypothetical protein
LFERKKACGTVQTNLGRAFANFSAQIHSKSGEAENQKRKLAILDIELVIDEADPGGYTILDLPPPPPPPELSGIPSNGGVLINI